MRKGAKEQRILIGGRLPFFTPLLLFSSTPFVYPPTAATSAHSIPKLAHWQRLAFSTGCGQLQTRKKSASRDQRPVGCPTTNPVPLAAMRAAFVARRTRLLARARISAVESLPALVG